MVLCIYLDSEINSSGERKDLRELRDKLKLLVSCSSLSLWLTNIFSVFLSLRLRISFDVQRVAAMTSAEKWVKWGGQRFEIQTLKKFWFSRRRWSCLPLLIASTIPFFRLGSILIISVSWRVELCSFHFILQDLSSFSSSSSGTVMSRITELKSRVTWNESRIRMKVQSENETVSWERRWLISKRVFWGIDDLRLQNTRLKLP